MGQAKVKHRPGTGWLTWEFALPYSIEDCLTRVEHLPETTRSERYILRAHSLKRLDNGLYSFQLQRSGPPFTGRMIVMDGELDVFVEQLDDGSTLFYGSYDIGVYQLIFTMVAIPLILIFVPMGLAGWLVLGASMSLMGWLLVRNGGMETRDLRWLAKLMEQALNEVPKMKLVS